MFRSCKLSLYYVQLALQTDLFVLKIYSLDIQSTGVQALTIQANSVATQLLAGQQCYCSSSANDPTGGCSSDSAHIRVNASCGVSCATAMTRIAADWQPGASRPARIQDPHDPSPSASSALANASVAAARQSRSARPAGVAAMAAMERNRSAPESASSRRPGRRSPVAVRMLQRGVAGDGGVVLVGRDRLGDGLDLRAHGRRERGGVRCAGAQVPRRRPRRRGRTAGNAKSICSPLLLRSPAEKERRSDRSAAVTVMAVCYSYGRQLHSFTLRADHAELYVRTRPY